MHKTLLVHFQLCNVMPACLHTTGPAAKKDLFLFKITTNNSMRFKKINRKARDLINAFDLSGIYTKILQVGSIDFVLITLMTK